MTGSATILAIETATSSCSVALAVGGRVSVRSEIGNNVHSQVLLKMISDVFNEAEIEATGLDAVAVGQGPGSFTGLRIGVGVGQGIAYGAECPMIGMSSLDALALQASVTGSVIATIDARMGEVYWCEYQVQKADIARVGELKVTPAKYIDVSKNTVFVGNAWDEYESQFSKEMLSHTTPMASVKYPSASAIADIAQRKYRVKDWIKAAEFAPIYVRDNVAKKAAPKL